MKHFLGLMVFAAIVGGGILHNLYSREDDLSLQYNLWKLNIASPPSGHFAWSLYLDGQGRVMKGMTKEEIQELFPDAHQGPSHAGTKMYEYEAQYCKYDIGDKDHLWLDQWYIAAFFEEGRLVSLQKMSDEVLPRSRASRWSIFEEWLWVLSKCGCGV